MKSIQIYSTSLVVAAIDWPYPPLELFLLESNPDKIVPISDWSRFGLLVGLPERSMVCRENLPNLSNRRPILHQDFSGVDKIPHIRTQQILPWMRIRRLDLFVELRHSCIWFEPYRQQHCCRLSPFGTTTRNDEYS